MLTSKLKEVAAMLKAIHTQEDAQAAKEKAGHGAVRLREMHLARLRRSSNPESRKL